MLRSISTLVVLLVVIGCSDTQKNQAVLPNDASAQPIEQPAPATNDTHHEFQSAAEVIVPGRHIVDVMEFVGPTRFMELSQQMQKAITSNPDWWLEHASKAQPGKPLPYDARIGLSMSEYDEYLALAGQMKVRKKREAVLTITEQDDHVFILDGGEDLTNFTGIEIDLKKNEVRTPFGTTNQHNDVDASEASSFGAWQGITWRLEDVNFDELQGTIVKFRIGKLSKSGRGVLSYDVKKLTPYGKIRIAEVLNFDLPAAD